MKSVVSSYNLIDLQIEEAIETILQNGWKAIEVMCEGHGYEMLSWSSTKRKNLQSLLNEYGANIHFHAPITNFNPASDEASIRMKTDEVWERCMELVDYFDSGYILFHPGRSKDHERGLESIRNYFQQKSSSLPGQALLILENVPPYEGEIGTNSSDLLAIIEVLQKKNTGLCFDTGHAFLSNQNSFNQELSALKPFIKVFHLNDNHGLTDEHLALGDGEIPFDGVIQMLKEGTTDYYVNFEMKSLDFANKSHNDLKGLIGK
ncbi:sugar phosphate isomerase/epimerase family protein [Bacillus sp. B-jedd]|uniref:sugar phosphate isomerase/epimerase family protein n=1 Tax=Bacillus sp. B-jedd TaxID=1476857 RepID=UPI00051567E1|nr:sugar phosphate isomerase/epimerase family protein [Bacillus sp. B-jedd]CEG25948.1 xylose isomerase domain-containing protein [Bacillus sp. B-jedd]